VFRYCSYPHWREIAVIVIITIKCRAVCQGCTNPGLQVFQATNILCTVAPNIGWSFKWNSFHVTLSAPRILRSFLVFFICAHLLNITVAFAVIITIIIIIIIIITAIAPSNNLIVTGCHFLAHTFSLSLSVHETPTHPNKPTHTWWLGPGAAALSLKPGRLHDRNPEWRYVFATGPTSFVRRDITVTSSQFVRTVEKRCTTIFVSSVLNLVCSHDLPARLHTSRTVRSSLRFLCGFAIKCFHFPSPLPVTYRYFHPHWFRHNPFVLFCFSVIADILQLSWING
jgi:hypothetical protein